MTMDSEQLDVRSIDERTRARRIIAVSREDGKTPHRMERQGDLNEVATATGEIAAGEAVTVYLTENLGARGSNVFRSKPMVEVERDMDATPGGPVRAGEPRSPSRSLDLILHTNRRVCWDPSNEVWSVIITNDSGAKASFHVTAMGF